MMVWAHGHENLLEPMMTPSASDYGWRLVDHENGHFTGRRYALPTARSRPH